ncbi:MAG TPA: hypothetical protein VMF61_11750 [Candidatus Acidoferrales bacterium]|nr:hypothetical protein [Candidatus Acidoferrales bacterium]
MLLAFALSIAIHEVLAGLIPAQPPPQSRTETVERATIARIEHRPLPIPPPRPPPRRAVRHARVIAVTEFHAVAHTTTGRQAPKAIVHHAGAARPKPPKFGQTRPVWDLPVGGRGAGAGNGAGAGSVGNGGTGTGAGDTGNGNGAAAGTQPCGFVEFSDPHGSKYDARTGGFWVDIRLTVHFPDGHSESQLLDYPFYYASEALNPWSDRNRSNPAFPTLFQTPPPQDAASEPPLVQYVMAHTTRDGYTLLKDCPSR